MNKVSRATRRLRSAEQQLFCNHVSTLIGRADGPFPLKGSGECPAAKRQRPDLTCDRLQIDWSLPSSTPSHENFLVTRRHDLTGRHDVKYGRFRIRRPQRNTLVNCHGRRCIDADVTCEYWAQIRQKIDSQEYIAHLVESIAEFHSRFSLQSATCSWINYSEYYHRCYFTSTDNHR